MDKGYFVQILNKYLKGTASEEEHNFLLSYYELFSEESEVMASFTEAERARLKEDLGNEIWSQIEKRENRVYRTMKISKIWYRASVAAIILLVLSTGLYFLNTEPQTERNNLVKKQERKEHTFVRLPDGTTVIVSAGSKLNYPSSFDGLKKREVYLEGQAYFDVKHNAQKPFIIHTGGVATTVLGTAFNIQAWPTDKDVTVTVTRGKVKVDEQDKTLGVITPNQQITFDKENKDVVLRNVNADQLLDWKDQDLLLNNVTVGEASDLLQTRFKVKITITDDQFRNSRFTTTFQKEESLEQVLTSICEFNNATYTYNKDKAEVILSVK